MVEHFINWLKTERQVIKSAPFSFAVSVLLCAGILSAAIFWYEERFYKQEIVNQATEITLISQERDRANRDYEKSTKHVEELRINRSLDIPLKKKALILAGQIHEFTRNWKDTDSAETQTNNVNDYIRRFGLRAQITRDDLDQAGQHSDRFDKAMYDYRFNYEDTRTIADEIERLANNIPD